VYKQLALEQSNCPLYYRNTRTQMRGTHLFDRILNHFPPLKNTREVTLQLNAERMATWLTLPPFEISR
jgi:hypothetical protein